MPLRIVFDARRIRDFGVGTYIRNLVGALGSIDHANQFFLIVNPDDAGEVPAVPANFETVPYDGTGHRLLRLFAFPHFLRQFRADLFHIPINDVPILMPKPYIVTVHDMSTILFGDRRTGIRDELKTHWFRRGLLRAEKVICVSNATLRDVQNTLGIPESRLQMIYNAPDPIFTAQIRGLELDQSYRTMERYQINYPFLLYAGNIRPQKNIPRLVEAFAVLRGELSNHPIYSDLRLIIIGDEISKYPSVRHSVIQSRVEHAVRFLGFVPINTLRIFYKAAAAFVFPSLYEGFGLPPLEAMACGTPVITSNVSSLPEVVGDAAIIVNPENVFDIARGIREALLDDPLRQKCIVNGLNQVRRFSWRRTAEQVLAVYREVAAGDRTRVRVDASIGAG
jgi:glycosyltransferase involved in cell wall biosynthesis